MHALKLDSLPSVLEHFTTHHPPPTTHHSPQRQKEVAMRSFQEWVAQMEEREREESLSLSHLNEQTRHQRTTTNGNGNNSNSDNSDGVRDVRSAGVARAPAPSFREQLAAAAASTRPREADAPEDSEGSVHSEDGEDNATAEATSEGSALPVDAPESAASASRVCGVLDVYGRRELPIGPTARFPGR